MGNICRKLSSHSLRFFQFFKLTCNLQVLLVYTGKKGLKFLITHIIKRMLQIQAVYGFDQLFVCLCTKMISIRMITIIKSPSQIRLPINV